MKVIIKKDYLDLSKEASNLIELEIKNNPKLVLGLATGSTPLGTYKELIKKHIECGLDFSEITTFNLDEYLDICHDDSNSYHYFMYENFFNHININSENIYIPNGKPENVEDYCKNYDNKIQELGGIDLQILGIGENGHIGFNEPNSEELYLGTHITDLTESTIKANARFFNSMEEVPKKAITMGLGSIMKSKKIILLASGKKKAQIIKKLLSYNAISTKIPASILLLHPNITIILDEEAATV
ncbi:glucosamine-6-phosphate deaminase [Clostridium sp. Cult2]|uniref:glucosamine-6-phosphate deaminase n=1 Tax=Clostridium sp. Cult2 TaxID=2079003 RepID=UPI001F023BC2|nr:glucosamine-6-phosphate deaminase [Clostridium sp. Cult2]MCF6466173.1 glucosamine-6-phosphate deaminase [Clostridium sp. Cult2]